MKSAYKSSYLHIFRRSQIFAWGAQDWIYTQRRVSDQPPNTKWFKRFCKLFAQCEYPIYARLGGREMDHCSRTHQRPLTRSAQRPFTRSAQRPFTRLGCTQRHVLFSTHILRVHPKPFNTVRTMPCNKVRTMPLNTVRTTPFNTAGTKPFNTVRTTPFNAVRVGYHRLKVRSKTYSQCFIPPSAYSLETFGGHLWPPNADFGRMSKRWNMDFYEDLGTSTNMWVRPFVSTFHAPMWYLW